MKIFKYYIFFFLMAPSFAWGGLSEDLKKISMSQSGAITDLWITDGDHFQIRSNQGEDSNEYHFCKNPYKENKQILKNVTYSLVSLGTSPDFSKICFFTFNYKKDQQASSPSHVEIYDIQTKNFISQLIEKELFEDTSSYFNFLSLTISSDCKKIACLLRPNSALNWYDLIIINLSPCFIFKRYRLWNLVPHRYLSFHELLFDAETTQIGLAYNYVYGGGYDFMGEQSAPHIKIFSVPKDPSTALEETEL